jgi:hypothetical protein
MMNNKSLFRLFLIALLIFTSCNSKNTTQTQKEEFAYGVFAKKDTIGKFPYIMNVYTINEKKLEINSYNEKRNLKNLLGSVDLTWATSKNGTKVGFNVTESQCVVFFENHFYFQNGPSASSLISDLMQHNDFDNSLFLQEIDISADGRANTEINTSLVKLTEEEVKNFQNSQSTSYEEVVKEIIESMN